MSDLEKFNVDSDLQSIADAMTVAGLNFCGGVFDHLETGEEFELTIAKKSGVRSMADEIAELRCHLRSMIDESMYLAEFKNKTLRANIRSTDLDEPEWHDYQAIAEADKYLNGAKR